MKIDKVGSTVGLIVGYMLGFWHGWQAWNDQYESMAFMFAAIGIMLLSTYLFRRWRRKTISARFIHVWLRSRFNLESFIELGTAPHDMQEPTMLIPLSSGQVAAVYVHLGFTDVDARAALEMLGHKPGEPLELAAPEWEAYRQYREGIAL